MKIRNLGVRGVACGIVVLALFGCSNAAREASKNDAPSVTAIPNTAPVTSNVTLSASATAAVAGTVLTANYMYFDAEGDLDASTRRWLRNGVAITGALGMSYIATSADVGQSIKFEVTPKATAGILSGVATLSTNSIAINFTIGGTVLGLAAGASIVLLNGADQLIVSANGPFAFPLSIPIPVNGTPYNVTIQTPPANQPCTHTYGAGTIKGANVTNINVFCGPPQVARFDPGGALVNARQQPGVALLANGKVFVAGGHNVIGPMMSAELYDPASNNWSAAANMTTQRYTPTATLLLSGKVLVVGGSSTATSELYDPAAPATNSWSDAGNLSTGRYQHTATLLSTGKVLVVGGFSGSPKANAEIYDPAAPAATAWSAVSPLTTARYGHTATLLPGDKVLVISGEDSRSGSVEIYDPAAAPLGAWTAATSLPVARWGHTATLLNNGKVLVAGGWDGTGTRSGTPYSTVDIYDPTTHTWAVGVASLTTARYNHTAALLSNGKVLVVGGRSNSGYLSSTEIYDPDLNTWASGAQLVTAREYHITLALPGGQVLVAGGTNGNYLASTELFNYPGTWSAAASFVGARTNHTSTLLPNGQVLVAGGRNNATNNTSYLSSAQIYDPTSNKWSATTNLTNGHADHTATLLQPDLDHPLGQVLIVGGRDSTNSTSYFASAELYDPNTRLWSAAKNMLTARGMHTATYLPPDPQHLSGQVLVAGGINNGAALANVELYDPAKNSWSSVGNLQTARMGHTTTLLPNGKILVTGGADTINNPVVYSSAELFDPAAASKGWLSAGNLSLAREWSTATLLPNGLVVVAGGWNGGVAANIDIYDSASNTWLLNPPSLIVARSGHTSILLPTGKILISAGNYLIGSSELCDPVIGACSSISASTQFTFNSQVATLLANGTLLVTGTRAIPIGANGIEIISGAGIYW